MRAGLLYGIGAYGFWSLLPLYFRTVDRISPIELLAHRIVWSFLLLAVLLTAFGRWPDFAGALRSYRTLLLLAVSDCPISHPSSRIAIMKRLLVLIRA